MQRKNVTASSGPLKLHFHHLCPCSLLLLLSLSNFTYICLTQKEKARESVKERKRKQRSNIIINHDREEKTFLKQDKRKGLSDIRWKNVIEWMRGEHFQSLPIVPFSFHPFLPSKSLFSLSLSLSLSLHLSLYLNFNVSIKWSWNESRNVCSTWMLLGLPIQSSLLSSRLSFLPVLSYPFSFPNHLITTTCTSSFCLILFVSLPLSFPLTNLHKKTFIPDHHKKPQIIESVSYPWQVITQVKIMMVMKMETIPDEMIILQIISFALCFPNY